MNPLRSFRPSCLFIQRRALNMAKVLIALGADVNYVNSKNLTAFDIASMMSDENALELLKSVGGLPSSYVYKDTSTKMESEEEMRSQSKLCEDNVVLESLQVHSESNMTSCLWLLSNAHISLSFNCGLLLLVVCILLYL